MAVEGVPFGEAIDYLQGKVNLPTQRWDDLRHGAHVRAFSVAGVTRDDMLADFRAAIEKAREKGTGYDEFRRDFDAIVDRTGWKFNARGSTDEERRDWRARIIYRTNMRTSFMAGKYRQLTDPDVLRYRPWWRYRHSGAMHPRLTHLALDGKVFAASSPVWRVYFPPNGWGCGCDVEALSDRQLKALGKTGPDEWPLADSYPGIDPRTGEEETRWPGVDRGWEYNVGEDWLRGTVPTELRQPLPPYVPPAPSGQPADLTLPAVDVPTAPLPPLPAPTPASPSRLLPAGQPPETYAQAFLSEFGAAQAPKLHRDKSGGIVTISRDLFERRDRDGTVIGIKADSRGRGRYMLLAADAIADPDEIWVDWAAVASGVVLKRAYLKRFVLEDGTELLVRFEWTSRGWIAVTAFDTSESYLENMRRGALIYRRPE